MEEKLYTIKDIAKLMNKNHMTIQRFIWFCLETKTYKLPNPEPWTMPYAFTLENAKKIMELFNNKPHGIMREFNLTNNQGKAKREKAFKKFEERRKLENGK
jgi:hypothetical protein